MNRGMRWLLGGLGCLVILAVCACLGFFAFTQVMGNSFEDGMIEDPLEVAQVAAEMADIRFPPGYETFAVEFMGFSAVMASDTNFSGMTIMLMKIPFGQFLNNPDMFDTMTSSLSDQISSQTGTQGMTWEYVDTITRVIRGTATDLTLMRASSVDGYEMQQLMGVFAGKDGPVLLMIMGPRQAWNMAEVDSFLQGIK